MRLADTIKTVSTFIAFLFVVIIGGVILDAILVRIEPMLLMRMPAEWITRYLEIRGFGVFIWQWAVRFEVILFEYLIVATSIEWAGNVLPIPHRGNG